MIKVLLIADVRLYREGLTHALARRAPVQVLASISNHTDILTPTARLSPDVVLIDMGMSAARSTLAQIRRGFPFAKTIGLAVNESESEILRCLEMGLSGYVPREGCLDDLVLAIKAAGRGEIICPPRITAALVERVTNLAEAQDGPDRRLTHREKEVTILVHQGLSNKQIAQQLHITLATVKNHVHNVLRKLRVHKRLDAARRLLASAQSTVQTHLGTLLLLAPWDLVAGFTTPV